MTADSIASVGNDASAPQKLAKLKTEAAAVNTRQTQRLANLQAASRNDLVTAALFIGAWGILTLLGLGN